MSLGWLGLHDTLLVVPTYSCAVLTALFASFMLVVVVYPHADWLDRYRHGKREGPHRPIGPSSTRDVVSLWLASSRLVPFLMQHNPSKNQEQGHRHRVMPSNIVCLLVKWYNEMFSFSRSNNCIGRNPWPSTAWKMTFTTASHFHCVAKAGFSGFQH